MMIYIGAFIALQVIVLVAYWLMKKNKSAGSIDGSRNSDVGT